MPIDWDEWDRKLRSKQVLKPSPRAYSDTIEPSNTCNTFDAFPRGTMPPTQAIKFKKDTYCLVEMLLEEKKLLRYLSVLAFLKEHPKMNGISLHFAAVGSDLKGSYTSRILVSPIKVKSHKLN